MTTLLLVLLVVLDFVLLSVVYYMNRRQVAHVDLIAELSEERRLLNDLRSNVQDELKTAQVQNRHTLEKITILAAEAEQEVRSGSEELNKELSTAGERLSQQMARPLADASQKQVALEGLLRKLEQEKSLLQKTILRGERLFKLFDEKLPVGDVMSEMQDRRINDTRQLLAKGLAPQKVASELGISEAEVRLVAGLATR